MRSEFAAYDAMRKQGVLDLLNAQDAQRLAKSRERAKAEIKRRASLRYRLLNLLEKI